MENKLAQTKQSCILILHSHCDIGQGSPTSIQRGTLSQNHHYERLRSTEAAAALHHLTQVHHSALILLRFIS